MNCEKQVKIGRGGTANKLRVVLDLVYKRWLISQKRLINSMLAFEGGHGSEEACAPDHRLSRATSCQLACAWPE